MASRTNGLALIQGKTRAGDACFGIAVNDAKAITALYLLMADVAGDGLTLSLPDQDTVPAGAMKMVQSGFMVIVVLAPRDG